MSTIVLNWSFRFCETDAVVIKVVSGVEATEEHVAQDPEAVPASQIGYEGRIAH